jgi:hypothetical protein
MSPRLIGDLRSRSANQSPEQLRELLRPYLATTPLRGSKHCHTVSSRGLISREVLDAYHAATS